MSLSCRAKDLGAGADIQARRVNAKREKIMRERGIDPIALQPPPPQEQQQQQRETRDDRRLEEQGGVFQTKSNDGSKEGTRGSILTLKYLYKYNHDYD